MDEPRRARAPLGAIAQLGERLDRTQEVGGSSPPSSIYRRPAHAGFSLSRVTVESADGKGNRWSTVGVSENIVDASFEALTDSIVYKLYRDQARA